MPEESVIKEIQPSIQNSNQSIIFTPTRANFKYLICNKCGQTTQCPYCSVGMSLHLSTNTLHCHYCNYIEPIPKECHHCKNSNTLFTKRYGTEEIRMFLQDIFKQATIKQFDKDSVTTDKKLKDILSEFNKNQIDILVGTQMLSKGHDYHSVNLAVILGIDYILHTADFRSSERAISLIFQIAGKQSDTQPA